MPQPQTVEPGKGVFRLETHSRILVAPVAPQGWQRQAEVFAESLRRLTSRSIPVVMAQQPRRGDLLLAHSAKMSAQQYSLQIADSVSLRAGTAVGLSHGLATLAQMIGADRERGIPQLVILDQPDCELRIFMVDLGRNRHSLQVLKQTVDMLWFYKVPFLQLHLTDDQRFAFPSTSFPKLNDDSPDFSLEDLRNLEAYASARGVTIIPELDVPGHSAQLRKHYPAIFGKNPTELATLPESRAAIKTLVDEMLAVFTSTPYFHVGGDEAYGVPAEAQRDLINALNRHLRSRGKTTLVWEGPGLGKGSNKVSTDVIHMNWRTINFPADQMIQAGYQVINAAWDPLYVVDHYPRNNFTMATPQHIYEQLSLLRFKHLNPEISTFAQPILVPAHSPVLGYCMPWWEGREENLLRLCRPRLAAMAERAWNRSGKKSYADFSRRDRNASRTLQQISTPAVISATPLAVEDAGVFHDQTEIRLTSQLSGDIFYTLDGSVPDEHSSRYLQPILARNSCRVRAALFENGTRVGHVSDRLLTRVVPEPNLALGKPVTSSVSSGPIFCVERLTDGGTGNLDYYLGYPAQPEPIVITVDLQQTTEINQVVVHEYTAGDSWESYKLQIAGENWPYRTVGRSSATRKKDSTTVFDFDRTQARYVRILTNGHRNQVFSSFSRLTEVQVFLR